MKQQSDLELLTTLYSLRESAQKVLRKNTAEKQKFCLTMGELATAVELNQATDESLQKAFEEVMPSVLDKLASYPPNVNALAKQKFAQTEKMYALFGLNNCKTFNSTQIFLDKAKAELEKLTNKKVISRGSKAVTKEDSTVLALKEEIRRWIASTGKIKSDTAKATALKQLENTEKLNVIAKNNLITVDFGMPDLKAVFSVATKDIRLESADMISKFGGLQEVLGTEAAQKFAQTLTKHKKGKDYLTAKGTTADNAQKTLKNADKKKKDNLKAQEETLQKIEDLQKKLAFQWQKMIRGANPVLAWTYLIKHQIKQGNPDLIEQMTQNILNSKALWGLYSANEKEQKYNQASYYDKLVSTVIPAPNIKEIIENAYQQFAAGEDKTTCAKLVFAKAQNSAPQGLPKEIVNQVVLDTAFQFGMNVYTAKADDKKIEFMNKILATHNINIGFEQKLITEKCAETRLNDIIHEKDGSVKTYKKKMTALLYDMGKIIGDSDLAQKSGDIFFNADLKKRFTELKTGTWETFSRDTENISKAKDTKKLLDEEYGQNAETIVAAMREGREVKGDSLHHVIYAYYAPLLGNDKEKLLEQFNSRNNTVEVLCGHPALTDMHKDVEHRFNISSGGTVLVKRNNEKIYKTSNTAQIGDTLIMPVILIRKDAHSPFQPLMKPGQLFMTSEGKTISDPYGENSGNTLFNKREIKNNRNSR